MTEIRADFDANEPNLEASFDLTRPHYEATFDIDQSQIDVTMELSQPQLEATFDVDENELDALFEINISAKNLYELKDVKVVNPTQGQALTFNATSQLWTNTSHTAVVGWGSITGTLSDQTDLQNALNAKQNVIQNLATIESNAQAGKNASDTISTYGNIVTHNVNEFATSSQGSKADAAIQPNDNITKLNNNAGYITKDVNNLTNYTTTINMNTLLSGKQPNLTSANAGSGINITGEGSNVIISSTQSAPVWGLITGTLSDQTDLQNALDNKVTKNEDITGATKCKITYDSKGLVTAGANLVLSDLPTINLNDLGNVTITSPTQGQNLTYDSTNNVWKNTSTTATIAWGGITGTLSDQTDLKNALDGKQPTITNLATIESNAQAGKNASDTILTYGDIVTHDTDEFATAAQGSLADTSLQPNDNITKLNNNAGYITKAVNNLENYTTTSNMNTLLNNKVTKNEDITAGTHTKITYDSKGLVTSGSDLEATDIPSIPLSKISDVTATSTELNVLGGITATTQELNYSDGVTSPIQTQLDGKQPSLTSVNAGTGISITGSGSNIKINNTQTSAEWGKITGDITDQEDLQTELGKKLNKNNDITAGTHTKITYDSKGLVTGGSDLQASDIPNLTLSKITDVTVEASKVNLLANATSNIQEQLNEKVAKTDIINNVTSTDIDKPLAANQGKILQDQIDTLKQRGRYLSTWNCTTGLATTDPTTDPYTYQSGDYYIVGVVAAEGGVNYRPSGATYSKSQPSTVVETEDVKPNDTYNFDGTTWTLIKTEQKDTAWGTIIGNLADQTDLNTALNNRVIKNTDITAGTHTKITYDSKGLVTAGADLAASDIPNLPLSKISEITVTSDKINLLSGATSNIQAQLNGKQPTITNLSTIESNAQAGKNASDTIATYGDIVTHDVDEFATAVQGSKADTALQPNDNITKLTNNAGYITKSVNNLDNYTTTSDMNTLLNNKVTKNEDIIGATHTKITYDSKGLVTSGTDLTASDIPNLTLSKITDVTATATEVNYTSGVTSNIQTQLDGKLSSVPQATASELGGIKASPKSATETQEVKIDTATGKLYVAPSGSQIEIDNTTITKNTDDELQTVAIIDTNTGATKTWSGTRAQYNAITTKDENTLYYITDDDEIVGASAQWGNITGTLGNQQDLQTVLDGKEALLSSENAGTGISITRPNGILKITNTQTSAQWGNITGTISSQTDLQNVLDLKGDDLEYDTTTNMLYLTRGGVRISDGIEITGGGGQAVTFTLTSNNSRNQTIAYGSTSIITCNYNNSEPQSATAQCYVNNVLIGTQTLSGNGNFSFTVTTHLIEGANTVQIKVTDLSGGVKSLYFNINTIRISISSNFDSSIVYNSDVTFMYTPVGNVSKTIHFELDGTETTETITSSGRQLTKVLSGLTQGVHTFRVWATATVEGTPVTSNELYYEIMYATGTCILLASDFKGGTFLQGETITIPFSAYNSESLTTQVEVYVNEVLTSTMVADRTRQYWSQSINVTGGVEVRFEATQGQLSTTKSINLTITAVPIDVHPVTENLELYLSAAGRSNSDVNRNQWIYNNISCTLSGFNFVTDGWINNALLVKGGASVTIPLKIFQNDFRSTGKTIEIEFSTTNVTDYDSVVLNCMSGNRGIQVGAQSAILKSEQSQVSTKFKEDEKVRVSFVVESRGAHRLIYTFLNGIISGLTQYPDDDDFSQINPVNITIGSSTCDINVYTIRVYNSYLSYYDVLNNYIADTTDVLEKRDLFNRNNIYDDYSRVVYSKVLNQVPIMTITGELPPVKGNKKKVHVKYENQQEPARNFEMSEVTIDIQGTSSQYYPKKNYKISKMPQEYALRTGSIAEKVFTLKADYMESSHAHNTGLAKYVHSLYTDKTPPQLVNNKVRTTIDGFPIAMFYRATDSDTPEYFGVYNFNNDKESNNNWGFSTGCESWEVCNNTSPRCLFKSADFTDPTAVLTDFEARYPADYTNFSNLQALVTWVVGCDSTQATNNPLPSPVTYEGVEYTTDSANYRIAKFRDECEDHFNMDFLLTYYIFSEMFGMVDSRAKNMFLNYYTDGKWYPVFYDLDTAIGLNNEGVNNFNYNIEYHDIIGSEHVFNGETSALWNMLERSFPTEIKTTYNTLRNNNKLSYSSAMAILDDQQIAKICEAQYNSDAEFKYMSPLTEEGIATYLYTAQGSRINHIMWWLYNRFKYMDSKYIASDYLNNYITLRLYTPQVWTEVEPDASITLTSYIDQYLNILYGSYLVGTRASRDTATTITPPAITFNDTETIIYGADKITNIGDLSPLYCGTLDTSAANKLETLTIGHGGSYSNTNLRNVTVGTNLMLKTIDVRNCPNLATALDLSGCTNIQTVKATGTSLPSVKLPEAGSLQTLELPNTITNLTVKNQNSITTYSCAGYTNVTTLVLENTNLNSKNIFTACTNCAKVRLTGIDWTLGSDFTLLDKAYSIQGQDEYGYNTPHGVLGGIVRMSNVRISVVDDYRAKFPQLIIEVTQPADEDFIVTNNDEIFITNDNVQMVYSGEITPPNEE